MTDFSESSHEYIERIIYFAQRLRRAAINYEISYKGWSENDLKVITLLDFDIIFSALPYMKAYKLSQTRNDENYEDFSNTLDHLIGPNTLRLYLKNLQLFTIPHGAFLELLHWKDAMKQRLINRSRKILENLHQASEAENPEEVIAEFLQPKDTINIHKLIRKEVNLIGRGIDDITLLKHILDKAKPIESFWNDKDALKKERITFQAFNAVNDYLQRKRPYQSDNNLRDAINYLLLVRLYNAPADENHIPRLISTTRHLKKFRADRDWFPLQRIPTLDKVRFIEDDLYFIVEQGLLNHCEGHGPYTVSMANKLQEDANDLVNAFNTWQNDVRNGNKSQSQYTEKLAQHRLQAFNADWAPVFQSIRNVTQLDRTLYANNLTEQAFREDEKDIRTNINQLISDIESYQNPIFDSWNIPIVESTIDIQSLFTFDKIANDGTPISQVRHNSLTKNIANDEQDSIRYALYFSQLLYRDWRGAILAVDHWLAKDDKDFKERLGFVWKHKATLKKILQMGLELLQSCIFINSRTVAKWTFKVFKEQGPTEFECETETLEETIEKIWQHSRQIEYFEIHAHVGEECFLFFADIHPLENIETQAGVVIPWGRWSNLLQKRLADALATTSSLRLSPRQYVHIVKFIVSQIGIKES